MEITKDTMLNSASTTSAGLILSTVVNHKVRCQLDISCDQYVVADFIHQWRQKNAGKRAYSSDIKRYTGFEYDQFRGLLIQLYQMEIVDKDEDNKWYTTDKWNKYFNFEDDFEVFWNIWQKVGNKQKAKEVYVKVRAEVDRKVLHDAAMAKVKATDDLKYLPHASTWLNPKYRHWEDVEPLKNKENVKQEGDFRNTTD